MNNYIPDMNRFKLAGPPEWFLRQLWEFDSSLVIVPSRQSYVYRLAQRRKLNLSAKIVNESLFKESDTQMLATYELVPVTSILATVNWSNPLFFQELRRRAPWRMGGADAMQQMVDAQDRQESASIESDNDNMRAVLAKDAWGMYNKKIGVRSQMYSPRVKRETPTQEPKAPSVIIKP